MTGDHDFNILVASLHTMRRVLRVDELILYFELWYPKRGEGWSEFIRALQAIRTKRLAITFTCPNDSLSPQELKWIAANVGLSGGYTFQSDKTYGWSFIYFDGSTRKDSLHLPNADDKSIPDQRTLPALNRLFDHIKLREDVLPDTKGLFHKIDRTRSIRS